MAFCYDEDLLGVIRNTNLIW